MTEMEPFTHCLRYHATEAVETGAAVTPEFKGELLGKYIKPDTLVFQCLHRVCCERIGLVVENETFVSQGYFGGIAACEYYGKRKGND